MATTQLVSGTGTTKTAEGYLLPNYPWVYIGGEVDTLTSGTGTGACTYYGLVNTNVDVLKLGCYEDVTLAPVIEDLECWCDGKRRSAKKLNGFTTTLTVTQDLIDLEYLRYFLRQSSGQWCEDTSGNIASLTITDMISSQDLPVLLEQHYVQEENNEDQYVAVLCFQCELSLGDITIDPNEGWRGELTIDVEYSETYGGYYCIMRKDSVEIV